MFSIIPPPANSNEAGACSASNIPVDCGVCRPTIGKTGVWLQVGRIGADPDQDGGEQTDDPGIPGERRGRPRHAEPQ
jgi:hypothetical protein